MAYAEFPIHGFGGVNLIDAPDEVGVSGAIDVLNVDFDKRGAVRQRDGYVHFNASAGSDFYSRIASFKRTGSQTQVVAARAVAEHSSFARVGTPTAEYLYMVSRIAGNVTYEAYSGVGTSVATQAAAAQIQRWDGTSFTSPGGLASENPKHLAVQPADNRLVGAHYDATNQFSRVKFSNAGAPETFSANDYVDLTPGDGEAINAMVAWQSYLLVFKETKFFVFYGNSTSSTGTTVFNYRPVETGGVGCSFDGAACASPHGVYFLHRSGVYRTTSGSPERVSDPIEPYFIGGASSYWQGGTMETVPGNNSVYSLVFYRERLYVAVLREGGGRRVLVFDPRINLWSFWDLPATGLTIAQTSTSDEELFFSSSATAGRIGRYAAATDDAGTAITSRYRSGFADFGTMNEKALRETDVWGTGTVGFAWSRDFASLDSPTTLTLGTSPTVARAKLNKSPKGTLLSFQLQSVSGAAWTVHRMNHLLQGRSRWATTRRWRRRSWRRIASCGSRRLPSDGFFAPSSHGRLSERSQHRDRRLARC